MGHSMGGFGTFFLGAKHNTLWAGIAPIAGGGVGPNAPAERLKAVPVLVMHGAEDTVVRKASSRAAVRELQKAGAQHLYLEFPGLEHEFFIRRGRENLEKVFHFFNLVSRKTNVGPIPEATQ
jgi:predicted esterase